MILKVSHSHSCAAYNVPVQWLRQCLGVCHGAAIIPEPLRGRGDPRHLRGERAAAAPAPRASLLACLLAPRALTRIGFTTVPRKALPRATRYGLATLAHEAIACSGASACAAAPPRAVGLTSRATLAHEAIACSGFSLHPILSSSLASGVVHMHWNTNECT